MARIRNGAVRPATGRDIPSIVEMGKRFHARTAYGALAPLDEATVLARLDREIVRERGVVFIAEGEGRTLGMLGATIGSPWFNERIKVAIELFWWVDEEARRSGAGRELLEELERWWPSRASGLLMMRTPNIEPALMDRLYRMRGFVPWDQYYCKFGG